MQETQVQSLSWEDPLEKGIATHSSILAGRIAWTEEPGKLPSIGLQRVGHNWATNTHKDTVVNKTKSVWAEECFCMLQSWHGLEIKEETKFTWIVWLIRWSQLHRPSLLSSLCSTTTKFLRKSFQDNLCCSWALDCGKDDRSFEETNEDLLFLSLKLQQWTWDLAEGKQVISSLWC